MEIYGPHSYITSVTWMFWIQIVAETGTLMDWSKKKTLTEQLLVKHGDKKDIQHGDIESD